MITSTGATRRRLMTGAGIALLAVALAACSPEGGSAPSGDGAAGKSGLQSGKDPFPSTYKPLESGATLIVNANVIDGKGGLIEGGAVLMEGGRIAAVGPALAAPDGTPLTSGTLA